MKIDCVHNEAGGGRRIVLSMYTSHLRQNNNNIAYGYKAVKIPND